MNIHALIEKAEKEGLTATAKYVLEKFDQGEAGIVIAAITNALQKQSNFLRIFINEEHGDMRVNCPLFDGAEVEIEDTCYGCRFNPGTGRWEGKDGEYFQCNFNPNTDTPVNPATRDIQRPTKSDNQKMKKEGRWVCPNHPDIEEVIAEAYESMDEEGQLQPYELGVLINAETGEATNRWEDGTAGVPEDIAEMAEEDEHPVCSECREYCEWIKESSNKKAKKQAQEEIIEEKVTLPDDEELSRFNGMTTDELHAQLQMYRELQKVLQDSPPGENIKVQDTIRIIDYVENLIASPQSVTPQELQESPEGAVIEEVPAEEVDEVKQEMAIAASMIKEAPDVLDRCVKDVMAEHEGDENFDQSNAYAICITSLRDKHPSVEEWVHKKKAEVETMEKIENSGMTQLTIPDLEKKLEKLREAEFVVRASMNVNNDASMSEGTRLLGKIKAEKDTVNQLLSFQMMPIEAETLDHKFAYDPEQVKNIPHKVVEEFKKVAKAQSEFDWETYLEVTPKLLVEQNPILHAWPALMAEAARQEIFTKISALPVDQRQEIFMEFMENVEEERKLATGEITSKKKLCRHLNADKTFKGGFDGCKAHFMECKGLPAENAEKLSAYIKRRAKATEGEIISFGERKGLIEKKAEIKKEASTQKIDPQQLFI